MSKSARQACEEDEGLLCRFDGAGRGKEEDGVVAGEVGVLSKVERKEKQEENDGDGN